MSDIFTLELPKNVPAEQLSALEEGLLQVEGVDDAGTLESRSIDPATVGMWIQAGAGVLGMVATAVPLVEKILNMVRGRGIKGAKIRFEGGEIEVDAISPAELQALVATVGSKQS